MRGVRSLSLVIVAGVKIRFHWLSRAGEEEMRNGRKENNFNVWSHDDISYETL